MNFIPNTKKDKDDMLEQIGAGSVMQLFNDIPQQILLKKDLDVEGGMSELEVRKKLNELSLKNDVGKVPLLGAGAYYHYIPAIVDSMIRRGEFYTAYTPYQPEISQGTLRAIFEWQTIICSLTGMEVANASMYDGSTACAEAMIMCANIKKRKEIIVSATLHPEYRKVMKTYADAHDLKIIEVEFTEGKTDIEKLRTMLNDNVAGVFVQNPNFFGMIEDLSAVSDIVHAAGALFVVNVVELTSLGMLKITGADIVVGEGQSFGNPVNFGGPYLGFITAKKEFLRQVPGRIVGETTDENGKTGYVLTMQAREQHIRRERAASNICSNESLCMLAALIHIVSLGKEGVKKLAKLNVEKAKYAYDEINKLDNIKPVFSGPFYNEFVVKCRDIKDASEHMSKNNFLPGLNLGLFYPALSNHMLICVTEVVTKEDIDRLMELLRGI